MNEQQIVDKVIDARGTGKIQYEQNVSVKEVTFMDRIIQQIWRV